MLYMLLNGVKNPPTCKCGCGEKTKFLDAGRGYSDYRWGHKARVKGQNNFHKNGGFEKSLKTRRKMFKKGTLEVWNKGKTKETNSSVAQYSRKISETISSNPEELKTRSRRMKQNRKMGPFPRFIKSNIVNGKVAYPH